MLSFINWLPDGLDTIVGENGNLLSPGQKQQVICARALLSKRSLYIFDEATSSLDAENERIIDNLITRLAKTAIVIVITHKMSRLKGANQVLFFKHRAACLFRQTLRPLSGPTNLSSPS